MDRELVIRAQDGDGDAYGRLAKAIAARHLAVARRILRDPELAADATQQALVAIWRDLPQLREPDRFEAWAYRLLVRACHREARRRRTWQAGAGLAVPRVAVDDALAAVVDRAELDAAFRRLSFDHRTVVVLHLYLDLPVAEIAGILDVPVGTVHSRLHYATRTMRASLERERRDLREQAYE
jgi:RNA polymerase sigma-70 factor (ECF subfamily)